MGNLQLVRDGGGLDQDGGRRYSAKWIRTTRRLPVELTAGEEGRRRTQHAFYELRRSLPSGRQTLPENIICSVGKCKQLFSTCIKIQFTNNTGCEQGSEKANVTGHLVLCVFNSFALQHN